MKPSIGRIVLMRFCNGPRDTDGFDRPAIVLEVAPDGETLTLEVFGAPTGAGRNVRLYGYIMRAPDDEPLKPGHWRWPPRV